MPGQEKEPKVRAKGQDADAQEVVDNDIKMVDAEVKNVSFTGPRRKGRRKERSTLVSVSGSQRDKSDVGNSGVKRVLEDSPSRARESVKRARKSENPVVSRTELDLSPYSFEGDSVIDSSVIPGVVGQVSIVASYLCLC